MTTPKKKPPPESDPLGSRPGVAGSVLLSDQIEFYCDRNNLDPPLIEEFDDKNLKPARYNLRLGAEAHVEGKPVKIDDQKPLVLEPHQVAVVRTYEEINLPRFLIGRWNLRVDMVYEGLLWVGALQVDPGWQGPLPCPIYNLANRTIELHYKEKIFSIDFVRTTPFQDQKTNGYAYKSRLYEPTSSVSLPEHDKFRLQSAVSATARDVQVIGEKLSTYTTAGVTLIAILFAALAVLSTASAIGDKSIVGSLLLNTLFPISFSAFSAAFFAVILSAYAATRGSRPIHIRHRWVQRFIGLLGLLTFIWGSVAIVAPHIEWLSTTTTEWIVNLPFWYGAVHVLTGILLLRIWRWELFAYKDLT